MATRTFCAHEPWKDYSKSLQVTLTFLFISLDRMTVKTGKCKQVIRDASSGMSHSYTHYLISIKMTLILNKTGQNLKKKIKKRMEFHMTSKICYTWKTFNFLSDHVFQCWFSCGIRMFLAFFWSLSDSNIACYTSPVLTMHVEQQKENIVSWKAEVQSWGHWGIGNVLPNIVKLPSIHRRLTRQKMHTDNLSLRRIVLAHYGN